MVNLSTFYNLNIYNTEGKYVGKVTEVVLNIKKGRISFFKTKALTEDNKNVGLRDVLRNSMRLVPDEEVGPVKTEGIIDIPYEIVSAVGDIITIDQEKFVQYQAAQQTKKAVPQRKKSPITKPMQKN